MLYRTDIDVWMRGMDYKQADSKEIGSRRNVVSQKNASNSMDSKKTNQEVLKEAVTERSLLNRIRKRQATFFGHVMRREKMEYDITTGMLEGNRSRGRPREKMLDGLTSWLKVEKVTGILRAAKDRDVWREMIANATKQGT